MFVGIELSRPTFVYLVMTFPTINVSDGTKTRTYIHYYTKVCNLESIRTVEKKLFI